MPTEATDDTALDKATDHPDAVRRYGVIPLPHSTDDPDRCWADPGSGPGWSPDPQAGDDR